MTRRLMAMLLAFLLCLPALAQAETVTATPIAPLLPTPPDIQLVLDVALAEVGYTEDKSGATKYGQWYGDATAEWCAEFLCWSVNKVDSDHGTKLLKVAYPLYGATNVGRDWFITQGRYMARKGTVTGWGSQWYRDSGETVTPNSYVPQPGDWVFFSFSPTGDTTHVAMVISSLKTADGAIYVKVVEGNMPDSVAINHYKLDDWRIQGYGTVRDWADTALRGGNEGEKVRQLQDKLIQVRLLDENARTGRYTGKTQEAVKVFQQMKALPTTGIANRDTQKALALYVTEYLNQHIAPWVVADDVAPTPAP